MPERLCEICAATISPERIRMRPRTRRCQNHHIEDEEIYHQQKNTIRIKLEAPLATYSTKHLINLNQLSNAKPGNSQRKRN